MQFVQVVQMSLIIQSGIVFDHLVVQHYQVLDDLRVGLRCHRFLVQNNLVNEPLDLVPMGGVGCLDLLLVVLVHDYFLLFKQLHDLIYALVRVLHHQLEFLLLVVSPNE